MKEQEILCKMLWAASQASMESMGLPISGLTYDTASEEQRMHVANIAAILMEMGVRITKEARDETTNQ